MISRGTLALFIFLFAANVFANTISFQKWKIRRVAEKNSVVIQVKRDKSLSYEARQSKLAQAQFNLQTEKDLTPEDYFYLYLVEQFKSNPESARETAKSLSKEELASLVVSYINATNQFKELEANPNRLQTSR